MSAEPNLPPDLAEVEARLHKIVLLESSINRDKLMYRAGWAAAEAMGGRHGPRHLGRWFWPATTAALAASVMVLATLLMQRGEAPNLAEETLIAKPLLAHSNKTKPAPLAEPWMAAPSASFLAMRNRALLLDREDLPWPNDDGSSDDDYYTSRAKTSRELLYELLPELRQPTDDHGKGNS